MKEKLKEIHDLLEPFHLRPCVEKPHTEKEIEATAKCLSAKLEIKNLLIDKAILENEIEELEGMKRKTYKEGDFLEHRNEHNLAYNECISDTQERLRKEIENLKKI